MCDTLFKKTEKGIFFGKNSDRSANEPNLCLFHHNKERNEEIACTYIKVKQKNPLHDILLVQPSWMWGGEMGMNDCHVVIGNEAVFTKNKQNKQERLLGMDLLRLALEQSKNAKEAVEVLIYYLEEYGQGGNCGFDKQFYYDNSFLITDGKETYIMETNYKEYKVIPIAQEANISNCLSIDPKFTQRNTNKVITYFSQAKIRSQSVKMQLAHEETNLTKMMEILSSHKQQDANKLFQKGSVGSVCMHQSLLGDHTTNSMIVQFHNPTPTIWLTGSSSPCLSIYKPCFFSIVSPPMFIEKQASFEYWLKREYLTRAIFAGYVPIADYVRQKKEIQEQFVKEEAILFLNNPTKGDLEQFVHKCSTIEQNFVDQFKKQIEQVKNDFSGLSHLWKKKMILLGNNVFALRRKERTID